MVTIADLGRTSSMNLLIFAVIATARLAAAADDSARPEWIWSSADRASAGQAADFSHDFQLSERVTEATLKIAADFSRCQVFLNQNHRLTVDAFAPWLEIDVTDDLRTGLNTMQLRAVSTAGPSAVACGLVIRLIDGTTLKLNSDDDWNGRTAESGSAAAETQVVSFGQVLPQMWTPAARVTSFDDYTQWKQAIDAEAGSDPATFSAAAGFQIQLIRSARDTEGSWVSLAFDPQGRLTIAREDKGLLRMTLSADATQVQLVETINDTLLECRGLLYAYDSLYANANNSKGLYRLRDTTGDGQLDQVQLLREFPGGVGHGRNDLALGPDGLIYSIHGDAVQLPQQDITDYTSPFREANRGIRTTEGHLLRTDADGRTWELIASGLRNPYGIDFNGDGQAFTYDADDEFDMGSSWYRPTRIVHLVSAADFGWRGRTGSWPPYEADHAGNALPVADVGKGSPTSVQSGLHSNFPPPWRDAMFVLDWAYGRILACQLQPRAAGYVCHTNTFLKGRPFNVTDLTFGPDGSMYVITGGRQTQSALYRIQYVGSPPEPVQPTQQQTARTQYSRGQRQLAEQLSKYHGRIDPAAVSAVWPILSSPDPTLRHAAQMALEHQPVQQWQQQALQEQDPAIAVVALLALSRSSQTQLIPAVLQRLNTLPLASLSHYQQQTLLRAYQLCLSADSALTKPLKTATRTRLQDWYPTADEVAGPTGTGHSVNRQLANLLLLQLQDSAAVPATVQLLNQAQTQEDRLHYLFVLRHMNTGWTMQDRRSYFAALADLDRTAVSGEGMPGFLRQIREEATATLTAEQRSELGELLQPGSPHDVPPLTIQRPLVKRWTADDLADLTNGGDASVDPERGRQLFAEALCSSCHRINGQGGVVGPDLTSVASRFGRRDLLTSIVTPSAVVAEKYRNLQIVTNNGKVIIGRVAVGGDYRSPTLQIATDPLRPGQLLQIAKTDISAVEPSPTSPMPTGLLDTFSPAEIRDLLAYLQTAESGQQ